MKNALLLISVILLIGAVNNIPQDSFSQEYVDTLPSITVSLKTPTPFFYQDDEGYTVVVGLIENKNQLSSVSNVGIRVNFYDDITSVPLEVSWGNTLMEVIPPTSEAPFTIRSQTPNSYITQASVSVIGFHPAHDKNNGLKIISNSVSSGDLFEFSGILQNTGAPVSEALVYVAFYDAFDPPRILKVSTIKLGDIQPNTNVPFELIEKIDPRIVGFLLFSESDIFYSDVVDVKIPLSEFNENSKISPLPFRYSSPSYQIKHQNIDPSEVSCNNSRELIFKKSSNLSACVFPSSVEKLIERNWAFPILE